MITYPEGATIDCHPGILTVSVDGIRALHRLGEVAKVVSDSSGTTVVRPELDDIYFAGSQVDAEAICGCVLSPCYSCCDENENSSVPVTDELPEVGDDPIVPPDPDPDPDPTCSFVAIATCETIVSDDGSSVQYMVTLAVVDSNGMTDLEGDCWMELGGQEIPLSRNNYGEGTYDKTALVLQIIEDRNLVSPDEITLYWAPTKDDCQGNVARCEIETVDVSDSGPNVPCEPPTAAWTECGVTVDADSGVVTISGSFDRAETSGGNWIDSTLNVFDDDGQVVYSASIPAGDTSVSFEMSELAGVSFGDTIHLTLIVSDDVCFASSPTTCNLILPESPTAPACVQPSIGSCDAPVATGGTIALVSFTRTSFNANSLWLDSTWELKNPTTGDVLDSGQVPAGETTFLYDLGPLATSQNIGTFVFCLTVTDDGGVADDCSSIVHECFATVVVPGSGDCPTSTISCTQTASGYVVDFGGTTPGNSGVAGMCWLELADGSVVPGSLRTKAAGIYDAKSMIDDAGLPPGIFVTLKWQVVDATLEPGCSESEISSCVLCVVDFTQSFWTEPLNGLSIPWCYDPTNETHDAEAAVQQGFAEWAAVLPIVFEQKPFGDPSCKVRVVWRAMDGPALDSDNNGSIDQGGVLGSALNTSTTSGQIISSLVRLDFNDVNASNIATVVTHEIGHVIGLGHLDNVNALMNAIANFGFTRPRTADIAAGRLLYPC